MCGKNCKLKQLETIEYEKDFDLKKISSFGIGGKADVVVFPKTKSELVKALSVMPNAIVIGNGTNILFSDHGIKSPIITTRKMKDEVCINGTKITVSAGVNICTVCSETIKLGLAGFENLYGIPATIGGALFMNAGAFGTEISSILESVQILKDGRIENLSKSDLKFGHRHSSFQTEKVVILEATFHLKQYDSKKLEDKVKENILWRIKNQPTGKSAGSIFKKSIEPAGLLIDKAGLKGLKIGGAIVSNKHANFIINENNASAKDVLSLIKIIKDKIYIESGVLLEEEIKYIGEQDDTIGRFPYSL